MKRVRKGYDELLHGQARAQEHAGRLRISQGPEPERLNSWVSLPVEACEALGITAALEDVPEPWERVAEAIREATMEHQGRTWTLSMSECRHIAETLGIKSEGES